MVELGLGVNSIAHGAFGNCNSLKSFICKAETPPYVTNQTLGPSKVDRRYAFINTSLSNIALYVPKSSVSEYQTTSPWSYFGFVKKIGCVLTLTSSKGGSIKFKEDNITDGTVTYDLPNNSKLILLYIPNYGYHIENIKVNNENLGDQIQSSTILNLNDDLVVEAFFAADKYKLTYVVDDSDYITYEIAYGDKVTPETEPIKEGFSFSGWSEIPATMPAHDVTIIGSFIINKYQVTYIIDGEVFATDHVEYGAAIIPPSMEDKEGFTFSGWADVPETMPAHDITIYGNFTSGIAEIMMESKSNVRIYSPNGKKIEKLQKGVNIVVLENGTAKKILVR